MNKLIKTIIITSLLFTGGVSFAQEDVEWKEKISELRVQHTELKASVDAGEITAEEAREKWSTILSEFRAAKDTHFEARVAKSEERVSQIAEKNPEAAERLQGRIDQTVERREADNAQRAELRQQLENGEITREKVKEIRVEKAQEYTEIRQDVLKQREVRIETFEAKRAELRVERDAKVEEAKERVGGLLADPEVSEKRKVEVQERVEEKEAQLEERRVEVDESIQKRKDAVEVRKVQVQQRVERVEGIIER